MDVLSNILQSLHLSSAVYFNTDFSAPWGMDVAEGPFAQFHMITKGECVLHSDNHTTKLYNGDIVVFPNGSPHWIADSAASSRVNGKKLVEAIHKNKYEFRGDKVSTTLICGHFEFNKEVSHPLIESLPQVIKLTDLNPESKIQIEEISRLIIKESSLAESGSAVITNRLAEVLFIHLLRGYMKTPESTGFFTALSDPLINHALQLIHSKPNENWTVDILAKEAAISRTNFFIRFKQKVGSTPLKYLTYWRMLRAQELLTSSSLSLIDVAEKVGYNSEVSFSKVFKKTMKQTPAVYRKKAAPMH